MKRVKDGEAVVMRTDKSGKFSITTREKYLEMGQVHIGNDKEVKRVRMREIDKIMNDHSAAWCSMWNTGKDHGHEDRILSSKMSRSENRANLYLSYKDHKKEQEKTRPIGTACTSNTRAFANTVSELLEAVANGGENKFEVISSEDLLHHTKKSNQEMRKIRTEMQRKKQQKRKCWNCRIWTRKCRECKGGGGPLEDKETGDTHKVPGVQVLQEPTQEEEIKEILEDILEQVMMREENCVECEKEKRKMMSRDCDNCGEGITEEEEHFAMVGMDAVALFPSMGGKNTAKIVRKKVEESKITWEGFNWKKSLIYLLANKHLIGKVDKDVRK